MQIVLESFVPVQVDHFLVTELSGKLCKGHFPAARFAAAENAYKQSLPHVTFCEVTKGPPAAQGVMVNLHVKIAVKLREPHFFFVRPRNLDHARPKAVWRLPHNYLLYDNRFPVSERHTIAAKNCQLGSGWPSSDCLELLQWKFGGGNVSAFQHEPVVGVQKLARMEVYGLHVRRKRV